MFRQHRLLTQGADFRVAQVASTTRFSHLVACAVAAGVLRKWLDPVKMTVALMQGRGVITPRQLTGDGRKLLLKPFKQIVAVVWAGRCLGVILNSECLLVTMADASDRVVIQIAMCDFEAIR